MNGRIADDRLWGVKAIADELGVTERQVRYGIEKGRIPAVKNGGIYESSRALLREQYMARLRAATAA
jgi:hypothetical protein